jgi:hypothetical protein
MLTRSVKWIHTVGDELKVDDSAYLDYPLYTDQIRHSLYTTTTSTPLSLWPGRLSLFIGQATLAKPTAADRKSTRSLRGKEVAGEYRSFDFISM